MISLSLKIILFSDIIELLCKYEHSNLHSELPVLRASCDVRPHANKTHFSCLIDIKNKFPCEQRSPAS